MNKDMIRKMLNAKFKYVVKLKGTQIIVEKYNVNINKKFINALDSTFYCLQDVKEYIKRLKSLNKFVKLQVIGL